MQFREQGRKVQCIRSVYDPAVKRSHQKVVASFDRWADTLPDLPELTDDERREAAEWFGARQAAKAERTNSFRARYGGQTLADLAAAIQAAPGELTPEQAAAIWHGMAVVGKALRKAGHPKPKGQRGRPRDTATIDLLYRENPGE
ncbi:hypothetical protein R088_24570 [Salmonella enterica subsp. enterica serovar Heidelberg]|nr:hypothetical protein [Salmonella enterica subsp. enterica serovar Heidelberg]EEK2418844.1 hypothetical protein [Salmonella enterica subsp. enterica serovar Heidelberg]EGC9888862.1 hypothetical protein [Salmonella enterica]